MNSINDVSFGSEIIQFLDFPTVSPEELELGSIDIKAGKSVLDTLPFVLELAKAKHIDGVIYAPFYIYWGRAEKEENINALKLHE